MIGLEGIENISLAVCGKIWNVPGNSCQIALDNLKKNQTVAIK